MLVGVWSADVDEPGVVEFGTDERTVGEVAATAQGNGKHSAVLVGLPPETAGWVRVRHATKKLGPGPPALEKKPPPRPAGQKN